MSEEQIRRSKEPEAVEDGEIVDSVKTPKNAPQNNGDTSSVKTSHKKRRSRYDELEDKFDCKFEQIDSKFERLFTLLNSQGKNVTGHSRSRSSSPESRASNTNYFSDNNSVCGNDDMLSLHGKSRFDSDSDDELRRPHSFDKNLSEKTKSCLMELFGDDAILSKKEEKSGIILDEAQKETLTSSYRCAEPSFLTAYNESMLDMFPVSPDTETFLQVPPVDAIIESCLIRRHGEKAAFSKSKSRGKGLFSQPYKMVERIAYKGHHAARMGIITQLYVQQSLGKMLQLLQSDDFDKEDFIKQIKDTFAMTTRGLDQFGRTGAFHHIIRRTLAMSDTALYELPDANKFSNLPLTGDGLFGAEFESLLKARKEQRKQIDDLLPDIQKKDTYKRKSYTSSSKEPPAKKPSYENRFSERNFDRPYKLGDNFRIPKVSKPGDKQFTSGDKSQSSGFRTSRPDTLGRSTFRGRSKPIRK